MYYIWIIYTRCSESPCPTNHLVNTIRLLRGAPFNKLFSAVQFCLNQGSWKDQTSGRRISAAPPFRCLWTTALSTFWRHRSPKWPARTWTRLCRFHGGSPRKQRIVCELRVYFNWAAIKSAQVEKAALRTDKRKQKTIRLDRRKSKRLFIRVENSFLFAIAFSCACEKTTARPYPRWIQARDKVGADLFIKAACVRQRHAHAGMKDIASVLLNDG